MTVKPDLKTVVSTKGQVILPKAIRNRRGWGPGTALIVQETNDGVLLTAQPLFARRRPEEVFGFLKYDGPPKTIADMDAAVAAEAKRRHARNRH